MYIDIKFPTSICLIEDIISSEENNVLIEHCLDLQKNIKKGGKEWYADVYNTHNTYDIHKDKKFNNLICKVKEYTNNFAKTFNSFYDYNISSSWINVYCENDYQEFHMHPGAIFSAVYCFTNPIGSGDFIIQSPFENVDMFPMRDITKTNSLNQTTHNYILKPRSLIIFRSFLKHMVGVCKIKEPRITAAFNIS